MTDIPASPTDNRRVIREAILPEVDIIIPCYNYGRFLRACLDSVLDQPECRVRALIIDDCSTDDSLALARSIAAEDSRVQVIAHTKNRGHIATYNEGIDWLAAEYMLLLSSDDMLAPGALARAIQLMEAEPTVAFVYGSAIQFSDEAELSAKLSKQRSPSGPGRIIRGSEFISHVCANPGNPIETATVIVRTALQKKVGGYRPELPHSGDMEMWLRLAAHGDVGEVLQTQAFTRIHAHNMRSGYTADRLYADYEQRHRAFQIFFEGQSDRLKNATVLAQTAYRSLAVEVLWAVSRHLEEAGEDHATTRLINLASTIDSTIRRTPLWWKTAVKRALGPRWWRAMALAAATLGRGAPRLSGQAATSKGDLS